MSFSELGLSADLLRAIEAQGYVTPTPVQMQAIPVVLAGRDVLAGAQTGTGKTAAFVLPMLQKLSAHSTRGQIRALILAPTRELAAQVGDAIRDYGRFSRLQSAVICGGAGMRPQFNVLRKGLDIVVATPGRLLDHLQRGTVDLSHIEMLVLDEADRMLDMGFLPDIERILQRMPKQRQTLLFSATFPPAIKKLASQFLTKAASIEVASATPASAAVAQSAYRVGKSRKQGLLSYLIGSQDWRQVLVFTRTKRGADRLAQQLEADGITAISIHGGKSQGARNQALRSFKQQGVRALVATDLAARGLDIDSLPHVVNYELPDCPEDYVHRIGRTGRGGRTGVAISLVSADEHEKWTAIEHLLKTKISIEVVDGFAPDTASATPNPGRRRKPGRSEKSAAGKPRSSAGPKVRTAPAFRADRAKRHGKPSRPRQEVR